MRKASRLPKRFPAGAKYVLESQGAFVRRSIELPDGRRLRLATRKAVPCVCPALREVSLVPGLADAAPAPKRPAVAARRRARAPEPA